MKLMLAGIGAFVLSMASAVGVAAVLGGGEVVEAPAAAASSDPGHAEGTVESDSGTVVAESSTITDEPGDSSEIATIIGAELPVIPEDTAAAIASGADTAHVESATTEDAAPALATLDEDTAAGVPESTASPSGSPIVTVVLSEATPADSARQARLGRIFASMQPREAAKVLEQMDDRDVVRILGMLQERQAAAVMASLPPPRAAAISRSGLGLEEGGP